MPEPKSFMEVLTESLDQWATKFVDQDGSAGQPSLGARMQEMEREIAILTESRDKLADELRERGQRIVAVEADRDLWKQAATNRGLELEAKDGVVVSQQTALDAARETQHVLNEIHAVLIGHGVGIDDDTSADLIEKLDEVLCELPVLRSRVRSQQESIAKLQSDLRLAQEDLAQLRTIHHEWVNGQREKPVGLNETLQRMDDVITMQIEALSPTKGTGKAVDIRRRMLAKYSIAHDQAHLVAGRDSDMLEAAKAIIVDEAGLWPWGTDMFIDIEESPDRHLHAAALLIAHYDAVHGASK